MLGGSLSNHDEGEVEDELAALEAEMATEDLQLPSVPIIQHPIAERPEEPVRAQNPERQAMLAS